MDFDFEKHAAHRAAVVAERGEWWGLVDADGYPVMDLPPVVDFTAPVKRLAVDSLEVTCSVLSRRGVVHPIVSELIAPGLGETDDDGRLEPKLTSPWFVTAQRGDRRFDWHVAGVRSDGPVENPTRLVIGGTDLRGWLDGLVFWSYPPSVRGKWQTVDRDFAAEWSRPRTIMDIKTAGQAFGFTLGGPKVKGEPAPSGEETIREAIKKSLETTWRVTRTDEFPDDVDPPVLVSEEKSGLPSEPVLIRPNDGHLLQELQPVAAMVGVEISVRFWWPGDPPVPGHEELDSPKIIVTVLKAGEV